MIANELTFKDACHRAVTHVECALDNSTKTDDEIRNHLLKAIQELADALVIMQGDAV